MVMAGWVSRKRISSRKVNADGFAIPTLLREGGAPGFVVIWDNRGLSTPLRSGLDGKGELCVGEAWLCGIHRQQRD